MLPFFLESNNYREEFEIVYLRVVLKPVERMLAKKRSTKQEPNPDLKEISSELIQLD